MHPSVSMTYTVKSVMPTGKEHPTYGTEFYVQFEEDEQAYPLWFKAKPEVGQSVDGEVKDGKFKKIKKEYKPNEQTNVSKKEWTPMRKDNSDGMRQGMCMNNAANYVTSLQFDSALTDSEWAETVFAYAQALYRMGDLKPLESAENGSDDVSNVQAVFKDAEKANG